MDLAKRIQKIITPTILDLGFEIVRVAVVGSQTPRLQIMAERKDGTCVDVEDCASISRAVSALMDVEDPITEAFTLEVSSPGIDRPLTRIKDFAAWAGFDARVEMAVAVSDRRRFTGRLMGVGEGETILIEIEGGEQCALPFVDLQRAKLLLTDELIAAATTEQTK